MGFLDGPRGLPLFKPPYGRITAINLNTGEHAWMVAPGDGPRQVINETIKTMTGKEIDVGPMGAGGGGPLLTKTSAVRRPGRGRSRRSRGRRGQRAQSF